MILIITLSGDSCFRGRGLADQYFSGDVMSSLEEVSNPYHHIKTVRIIGDTAYIDKSSWRDSETRFTNFLTNAARRPKTISLCSRSQTCSPLTTSRKGRRRLPRWRLLYSPPLGLLFALEYSLSAKLLHESDSDFLLALIRFVG